MKIETYADFIIFKDPKSNRTARRIWEIPPPENGIIRAQKTDSGDSEDIIPILKGDMELIHHSSPLPSTYVAFDFESSSSHYIE